MTHLRFARDLPRALLAAALVALLGGCAATDAADTDVGRETGAAASTPEDAAPAARQYTFSWAFVDDSELAPRGGTSTGAAIELVPGPTPAFEALGAPGVDKQERDRRAILAMAGDWRASFDFIETAGFAADYTPARPYRSWGTERVYVVEDREDFVSLQHILVMFMEGGNGETMGPFVVKHWRQDWIWEGDAYPAYQGDDRWQRVELSEDERRGAWVQTVWQVDDSPRYASHGRWTHDAGQSIWTGAATLRPLPRREFSVRDDYDVLRAVNRHLITPTGWVHEESNEKLVLGETPRVLAREAGLNRYEAITRHDWSAGDAYWQRTAAFWGLVRDAWDAQWRSQAQFTFVARRDDGMLFSKLFAYADAIEEASSLDVDAARAFIDETIASHLDETRVATR